MSGYVENQIVIIKNYDFVFELTNRIDLWPRLFTEYRTAEVLEKKLNQIKFQLTTFPEGERPSRTWTSIRVLDKEKKMVTAQRIDPTFPFEYMNICWKYEPILDDKAVVMTWIQEFAVHPECKFSTEEMESFLNNNTRAQMKSVKNRVENWNEKL